MKPCAAGCGQPRHPGRAYCRPCENAKERARRSPEQHRRRQLRYRYGISLEEYEALLEQQGGVCAICGEPCAAQRTLAVDHCHTTGAVRGLLCVRCNTALERFERPGWPAAAAAYLEGGDALVQSRSQ